MMPSHPASGLVLVQPIARLSPAEITPTITPPESSMTTAAGSLKIVPVKVVFLTIALLCR